MKARVFDADEEFVFQFLAAWEEASAQPVQPDHNNKHTPELSNLLQLPGLCRRNSPTLAPLLFIHACLQLQTRPL